MSRSSTGVFFAFMKPVYHAAHAPANYLPSRQVEEI